MRWRTSNLYNPTWVDISYLLHLYISKIFNFYLLNFILWFDVFFFFFLFNFQALYWSNIAKWRFDNDTNEDNNNNDISLICMCVYIFHISSIYFFLPMTVKKSMWYFANIDILSIFYLISVILVVDILTFSRFSSLYH